MLLSSGDKGTPITQGSYNLLHRKVRESFLNVPFLKFLQTKILRLLCSKIQNFNVLYSMYILNVIFTNFVNFLCLLYFNK